VFSLFDSVFSVLDNVFSLLDNVPSLLLLLLLLRPASHSTSRVDRQSSVWM
jgi:hypothetical protein